MSISKQILVCLISTTVILRLFRLGWIIDGNHGKPKKRDKYNGYTYFVFTVFFGWVLYELCNE